MPFRNPTRVALALAAPCIIAGTAPATAQRAQFAPQAAYSRLDKLSARVEAVRYENVASNRPSVIVYVMVRNESNAPVLLAPNSFDGTTLANGSSVLSGVAYTFPHGFALGEEGKYEAKTLATASTARIAFRYQLGGPVATAPLRLTLREKPLLKLPGKSGGGQAVLTVEGYVGAPSELPPLKTPPQQPVDSGGYQTTRLPDESFRQLGPLRARVDGVRYASSAGYENGPEMIEVMATVQNTLGVSLVLKSSSLTSLVVEESGRSTRNASNGLFKDAKRYETYALAPGEWIFVHYFHFLPDQTRLRAVRRLSLIFESFEQPGGTFTIDIPRLTALTEPQPAVSKQASPSTAEAGTVTGADAFRKTAYLDVRVDGVARHKAGGLEVVLTVRNKIGRRLGMQNDWQDYAVLGSDGVEYRTDGNNYGTSGSDRLTSTVWLENENEAKRTLIFPKPSHAVTPVRLIIREYGKEKASIELPH